jgi:hypothetical protein
VTIEQPARRLVVKSVVPVWLVSVLGAILVGLIAPANQYLSWLPIVLATAVLLTFCIQLALVQKEGLVDRMMACLGGSIIILGVATVILGILQLAAA